MRVERCVFFLSVCGLLRQIEGGSMREMRWWWLVFFFVGYRATCGLKGLKRVGGGLWWFVCFCLWVEGKRVNRVTGSGRAASEVGAQWPGPELRQRLLLRRPAAVPGAALQRGELAGGEGGRWA